MELIWLSILLISSPSASFEFPCIAFCRLCISFSYFLCLHSNLFLLQCLSWANDSLAVLWNCCTGVSHTLTSYRPHSSSTILLHFIRTPHIRIMISGGRICSHFSIFCSSLWILKLLSSDLRPSSWGLWLQYLGIYSPNPYYIRTSPTSPQWNEHCIFYLTTYRDTPYNPYLVNYNFAQLP